MRPIRPLRLAAALALPLLLGVPGAFAQGPLANPNDWLLNAPDDRARFRALQDQAGGFHVSMLAVGQRYQAMHDAVRDGNFALATYQWEKIRELIQTGYARRPRRQASADREFVQKVYEPVREAFRSNDQARAWSGFAQARAACMACHEAERVAFMNDQALFRTTVPPR